jgi:hypothetical protein
MSALSHHLLSIELPEELLDREDWFGALPRQRGADPEAYRRPSPPVRDLPFAGPSSLPEEFLYQYHEAPREQEPSEGRLPTLGERASQWWKGYGPQPPSEPPRLRVPGPLDENGREVSFPQGREGGRQYLELPGVRLPIGQFAENPAHHLRHILDPFIATWGLGTAGAEAAAGLNTLSRMLGRIKPGLGDSKVERLREAPAR